MMATVQIELPEQLAEQARREGLLEPQKREEMLRARLKQAAGERLLAMMERLHAAPGDPLKLQEIQDEVQPVRKEARNRHRDWCATRM